MKKWTVWSCFRSVLWLLLLVSNWTQLSHAENEVYTGLKTQPEFTKMATNDVEKNELQRKGEYVKRSRLVDEKIISHFLQSFNYLAPHYSSQLYQILRPSGKNHLMLPEVLNTESFQPVFTGVPPRDNKRQGFSTWGGKRGSAGNPFTVWGGKRASNSKPFTWGVKTEEISKPFTTRGGKREENRPFMAWGGKRAPNITPFKAWGGKREADRQSFNSWGGKRSNSFSQNYSPNEDLLLLPLERYRRSRTNQSPNESLDPELETGSNPI